jgi:aspartate-semialdehyde dehydrogenase
LSIIPTCVRVPVLRAHSQAVTVTFKQPATEQQVRQALEHGLGLRIIDDRQRNVFPTPGKASGGDDILVGRVRPAGGTPLGQATDRFCLFLSGDQLRKGAALNAVQIAERLAGSSSHSGRAAAAASR